MRTFQVVLLALLAAITVQLGLLIVKLPPPAAHAMGPSALSPKFGGSTIDASHAW